MGSPSPAQTGFKPWPTKALKWSVAAIFAALGGLSALAWVLTVRGDHSSMVPSLVLSEDSGHGGMMEMEPMGAALFLGIWVTMMVAMMFPSVSPTVVSFWRVSQSKDQGPFALPIFVGGYLAVWTVLGVAAYLAYLAIVAQAPELSRPVSVIVAGGVVAMAGIYQLSRFKTVCLRHCRGPLEFLLHFKPGLGGALKMGSQHGLYCVGCCWGLMIVLFVVGLMNLAWMGVLAVVIFIEKIAPFGMRFAKGVGIGLIIGGLLIAVVPTLISVRA